MKNALVQLDANGDCLYATIIAHQIKVDYPDCHLTWWISSKCRHILRNNPHVDEVVEISLMDWSNQNRVQTWALVKDMILKKQAGSDPYDRIWMPQIHPDNFRHFDGTVRPSQFRGYDRPITVPINPILNLTTEEIDNVTQFVREKKLDSASPLVLFECSSNSSQSHVTPQFALEVARLSDEKKLPLSFLISTSERLKKALSRNTHSVSHLSMRENLMLLEYCSFFVGCGSGLTVIATCDQAKNIPNLQVLNSAKSVFASFFHDFKHFEKPTDRFIEMPDAEPKRVVECLECELQKGHQDSVKRFHQPIAVDMDFVLQMAFQLCARQMYLQAGESCAHSFLRYNEQKQRLANFVQKKVFPYCEKDKSFGTPCGKEQWELIKKTFTCK